MSQLRTIQGEISARDLRIAIVASRFNELVVEGLIRGAVDALLRHGATERELTLLRTPGAFELPLVVARLAASHRYDGIVALGAVIRGATAHFEHIAAQCSAGLARAAQDHQVPVGFGVLTTDTLEQALERAGGKAGNKGAEAALAVIEAIQLLRAAES